MSFDVIDSQEAYRRMQEEGAVYVDVRSQPEWDAGHPQGAVHVPMHKPGLLGLSPIREFLDNFQTRFPDKKARLVIGCAVGGRSGQACHLLTELGYTDVSNVDGGFNGRKHPLTQRTIQKGWKEEGLPVE